jgi:magnesium transporter
MRIIDVFQSISIVSEESFNLQHKWLAHHLVSLNLSVITLCSDITLRPAWIAHGILDSVVDSFFPFVEEIEEHVTAIQSIVYNENSPASIIPSHPLELVRAWKSLPAEEKVSSPTSFTDEKQVVLRDVASVKTAKTQFTLPRLTFALIWRRVRRAFSHFIGLCLRRKPRNVNVNPSFTSASFGLHRMARARRLLTSVTRVLATKPEVVAGIRKRLLVSDGLTAGDDAEVAVYFGDVQGQPKKQHSVLYMS